MAFTVNPTGTRPIHWSGQMVLSLSQYGPIPKLLNETDWRQWADTVVSLPAIAAVGAPRPERFSSWESWAHQFNQAVRLL
jgi:hypothetical protein